MVQLSFFENIKDKTTKLLPTPYMETVEECTAAKLSAPVREGVKLLCDTANTRPESVEDIVRAIRRRIGDEIPAVRHLTVLLLDAMIRACGPPFHVEVAEQKGLLRDLENIAVTPPTTARGMVARESALTLILNLSIWFVNHPDPRCAILTSLADDVRTAIGPNAFEGTIPDPHIRITTTASPSGRVHPISGMANSQSPFRTPGLGPQDMMPRRGNAPTSVQGGANMAANEHHKRRVVNAIPIMLPSEEGISSMLDTCIALNEYLLNSEHNKDGSGKLDDVIIGFRNKIEEDHNYVTLLLSSNLDVNRDLLRSISDSQSTVLESVKKFEETNTPVAHTTEMPAHHANERNTDTILQPSPATLQQREQLQQQQQEQQHHQQQQHHKLYEKEHQELLPSQDNMRNVMSQDNKGNMNTTNVVIPQPASNLAPPPPPPPPQPIHNFQPPPSVEDIFGPAVTAPVCASNDKASDSNVSNIFNTDTKPVVSVDEKGLRAEEKASEAMIEQEKAHKAEEVHKTEEIEKEKETKNDVHVPEITNLAKHSVQSINTAESDHDVIASIDTVAAATTESPSVNSPLNDQAESSAPQISTTLPPSSASQASVHGEAGKEPLPSTQKEESAPTTYNVQMQYRKDDKSKKDDNHVVNDDDDDDFDAFLDSHATN